MSKKTSRGILTLLIILCIIFLAACSIDTKKGTQTSDDKKINNTSQISKDMEYLCSDKCGGRKPDTPGSIKAREYICKRFKEMALEPLGSDYSIPYMKKTESINKVRLELLDGDKTIYTFKYGKDFVEISLDNTTLSLPLYTEPADVDCAVLADSVKNTNKYSNNSHIKLILIKDENNYRRAALSYFKGKVPQIRVSKDAFETLSHNIGKRVQFCADIDVKEIAQENIAGIIKGDNHDRALLISAHFDHIGSIGQPGSRDYVVWRGAFDNASGVSTMLETARCLKSIYKDQKPPYDIIFCAFNSEETVDKMGSQYFSELIRGKYSSIFDINLDCLGNNDNQTLFIHGNENAGSKNTAQKIAENLKKQNINAELSEASYGSDHGNFENAVCLTTDTGKSTIHTPEDTPDKINTSFLSETAGKLAYCIRDIISTIDIGSIKSQEQIWEGKSTEEQDMLTPSNFENKFNCKLDFLGFPKARILCLASRSKLLNSLENQSNKEDISSDVPKDISDIRYVIFQMDSHLVSFTTYKTNNTKEMEIYKDELRIGGFDNKSNAQQVNIDNNIYYIFTSEEGNKFMTMEYKEKDMLIRVVISSHELNKSNGFEQNKSFFEKYVNQKFIDGMVKLFQERG